MDQQPGSLEEILVGLGNFRRPLNPPTMHLEPEPNDGHYRHAEAPNSVSNLYHQSTVLEPIAMIHTLPHHDAALPNYHPSSLRSESTADITELLQSTGLPEIEMPLTKSRLTAPEHLPISCVVPDHPSHMQGLMPKLEPVQFVSWEQDVEKCQVDENNNVEPPTDVAPNTPEQQPLINRHINDESYARPESLAKPMEPPREDSDDELLGENLITKAARKVSENFKKPKLVTVNSRGKTVGVTRVKNSKGKKNKGTELTKPEAPVTDSQERERRKKHCLIERKRRDGITLQLENIARIIPYSPGQVPVSRSRGNVLEAAYDYIIKTTRENAHLVTKLSHLVDASSEKDGSTSIHVYHKMRTIECLRSELDMVIRERDQIIEQLKKHHMDIAAAEEAAEHEGTHR